MLKRKIIALLASAACSVIAANAQPAQHGSHSGGTHATGQITIGPLQTYTCDFDPGSTTTLSSSFVTVHPIDFNRHTRHNQPSNNTFVLAQAANPNPEAAIAGGIGVTSADRLSRA